MNNQTIKFISALLFFISINSFSQENLIKHKILKGETISSIARDNNISIYDIYKLNPTTKKVLKLNSTLLIAISSNKNTIKSRRLEPEITIEKTHQVLPKETLYGISKKYKTSIDNLKKWNPILENSSLEIGQIIYVSAINISKSDVLKELKTSENSESKSIIHEVLPKETKYSLAKKYNTTVAKLEELNPEIINNLPVGYKLITSQQKSDKNNVVTVPEKIIIKTDSIKVSPKPEEIKVVPNEVTIEIIQTKDSIVPAKPIANLELPDILEQRATENIGTIYHSGGTKPGGFDCSGLMIYAFENSGIKLPRTSAEQSRFGTTIDKSEAQKGDLIFFSTNGRGNINHVGMVLENIDGEIKFIHSSIHAGVIISSTAENYYKKTFKHINRVIE